MQWLTIDFSNHYHWILEATQLRRFPICLQYGQQGEVASSPQLENSIHSSEIQRQVPVSVLRPLLSVHTYGLYSCTCFRLSVTLRTLTMTSVSVFFPPLKLDLGTWPILVPELENCCSLWYLFLIIIWGEFHINTLLYLKWITNKDLLCSVLCGSRDRGGVWGRMDPHICMAESLRCSPKTIRTLLIGQYKIKNKLKTIYMCVCNWVPLVYSRI